MPTIDFAAALTRLLMAAPPLLVGIILHELAHAWMAKRCGDPTAERMGRITLNPLPHIDPTGLAVFAITSLTSPVVFGWAKPVMINPNNFRNLTRDTMLVAAAGPAANIILAFICTAMLATLVAMHPPNTPLSGTTDYLIKMLYTGIRINFLLACFNLLPMPPLDGSKILWGILPAELGTQYMKLERFGFIILILFLATGLFGRLLWPIVSASTNFALRLFGL